TLTAAVTTPLLVVGALLVAWITSSYILRQDSTALWEALPDHVMDATIALHHATIRACLTAFTAYEVTTEGDSFILATHNPHDALLLATAIHQQLLQCSWSTTALDDPQFSTKATSELGTAAQRNGESLPWLQQPQLSGVGVSSGLESDSQRTWNKAAGRMQYSGPGSGKQSRRLALVLQMAYRQLPADMVLVNVGDYQLKVQGTDPKQARTLYVCCPAEHVYRFLDACPVRCLRPLSTTFLDAPFSQAAVVYLYVVGLGSLAAWNSQVTATAMGLCLSILNRQLHLYGGYCVEQAESLCLATFCHPHTAIRWALACIQLCLATDWPQELLEHELGEEMLVPTPVTRLSASAAAAALQDARRAKRGRKLIGGVPPKPAAALHPDTAGTSQTAPPVAEVHPRSPDPKAGSSSRLVRVLLRGLRLKAGIDYGPVSASVHAALARMTYTGRVMNRCGAPSLRGWLA
ncbi:guanylate cyclase domain-containing protein, partial [Haematococcus lacustris]